MLRVSVHIQSGVFNLEFQLSFCCVRFCWICFVRGVVAVQVHDLYLIYLGRSLDLDYYITSLLHDLICHLVRFMKYSI